MNIRDKKIILCRPEGGIKDKFSQIETCISYAEKFGRIVIVDTDYKNMFAFKGNFSDYFDSLSSNLILDAMPYYGQLEEMSVFPRELRGRIHAYSLLFDKQSAMHFDSMTGVIISFKDKQYEEQILVHNQLGGSPYAKNFLKRVRLKNHLRTELNERIKILGASYSAIHIRNTDIKTNYLHIITELEKVNFDKLFLATDSKLVLDKFQDVFNKKIISFSDIPENNEFPLHFYQGLNSYQRNKDAILDLLTLALSKDLFIAKVHNVSWGEFSGFSLLAGNLKNDPVTLSNLISQ